jgi:hypothetical protein
VPAPSDPLLVLRMVEEQHHRDADDGRPVREGRTPPELLRPGDIEYRTCPYTGSRLGKPMNVSALKQMGARWDEIVGALALLRAAYTEVRGGAYAPDVLDVWRVSQLGSALPWFHILRAPDARAPAYAAALSKVTLGTGILTQALFVELLSRQVIPVMTAEALLEAAERTETMLAETEVCSASDKMIVRFLEVLVEPGRAFADASAAAAADVGPVAELGAQRAAVLDFGAHYLAFKYLAWMYYLARRFLYQDVLEALGEAHAQAAGARALLDEPCEPPDFFAVGPPAAQASLAQRGVWFRTLALALVPFAPGGGDAAQATRAVELAAVMADDPDVAELAGEVAGATGVSARSAAVIARALAQYARLDAIFGDAIACTESGFRTAFGMPPLAAPGETPRETPGEPPREPIDASVRDRLLPSSPRAYLTSLAPAWMAAHARP